MKLLKCWKSSFRPWKSSDQQCHRSLPLLSPPSMDSLSSTIQIFSSFRKGNINSKVCKHALRKRERGVNDDYLTFLGKWNEREREKRGTRKARQHHTPLSPLSFDIFLSLFSSVLIVINFSFSAPMHEKLVLSLSLINSNILNIIPFIHSFMHHHPSCIQTC